jgi:hypothetical protein
MFGESCYGFTGLRKVSSWKRYRLNIVKAVRNSILVNLDTADELHKNKPLELCDQASQSIRETGEKDRLNLLAIEYLIRVIFELMGRMPNHWSMKAVNRLEDWKADTFRKLTYVQTTKQKVELILSLPCMDKYRTRFAHEWELSKKLRHLKDDGDRFVKWFKREYPDIYVEIF